MCWVDLSLKSFIVLTLSQLWNQAASPAENDVKPSVWLKDVLTRLPDHKANKLHELLPTSRKSLE